MVTISAVVPAAGCGARAGLDGNKVLALLAGRPLLWWTLHALAGAGDLPPQIHITEIIIAARTEEFSLIEPIAHTLSTPVHLVEGGALRQDSVANAVRAATGDFVLVHDAARPLVSSQLIGRVCRAALDDDAAIAALPASDTVKAARVHDNGRIVVESTLERRGIWLAQTPQVFRRELLLRALEQAARDRFAGTDCASLVERLSTPAGEPRLVTLVEGETRNFKVTYPQDMERAALFLKE